MPFDIMGKSYVTTREIAAELKLHYRTILNYVRAGKMIGKRLGNKIIVEESVFRAYLNKNGLN